MLQVTAGVFEWQRCLATVTALMAAVVPARRGARSHPVVAFKD